MRRMCTPFRVQASRCADRSLRRRFTESRRIRSVTLLILPPAAARTRIIAADLGRLADDRLDHLLTYLAARAVAIAAGCRSSKLRRVLTDAVAAGVFVRCTGDLISVA